MEDVLGVTAGIQMLQISITIPKLATSRLSGFPLSHVHPSSLYEAFEPGEARRGNDWKCQQAGVLKHETRD